MEERDGGQRKRGQEKGENEEEEKGEEVTPEQMIAAVVPCRLPTIWSEHDKRRVGLAD